MDTPSLILDMETYCGVKLEIAEGFTFWKMLKTVTG